MMSENFMEICGEHEQQQQMFHLVQMLSDAGYPFYFNFLEDLAPDPFRQDGGDPETDIDWDEYNFFVELERGAGAEYPLLSVSIDDDGLLNLVDMRASAENNLTGDAAEDAAIWHKGITSEEAMDFIEKFFNER